MKRLLRTIVVIVGSAVVIVYFSAATIGGGGRGYFSPDTLDSRGHSEWLIPFVNVPVYRGKS